MGVSRSAEMCAPQRGLAIAHEGIQSSSGVAGSAPCTRRGVGDEGVRLRAAVRPGDERVRARTDCLRRGCADRVGRAEDHRPREWGRLRAAVDDKLEAGGLRLEREDDRLRVEENASSVSVRPLESVAVSLSSRCDGTRGRVRRTSPKRRRGKLWSEVHWQFDGQWWRISDQERAAAGKVLSRPGRPWPSRRRGKSSARRPRSCWVRAWRSLPSAASPAVIVDRVADVRRGLRVRHAQTRRVRPRRRVRVGGPDRGRVVKGAVPSRSHA